MELKISSFFFPFFIISSSAQHSCTYVTECNLLYPCLNVTLYGCKVNYINLDMSPVDNLEGVHWSAKSDADVEFIVTYNTNYSIPGRFESKQIPEIFCSKFPNLKLLSLRATTQMDDFNEKTFEKCFNLQQFELSNSQMARIGENAFKNLSQLKYLQLMSNFASEIASDAFKVLPSLEHLWLYHNNIVDINEKWFEPLKELKGLYLMSNNIKILPSNAFQNLEKLEKLLLYFNEIQELNPATFAPLKSLKYLDLFSNKIKDIPKGTFEYNLQLQEIMLNANEISILDAESFGRETLKGLKNLIVVGDPLFAVDRVIFEEAENLQKFLMNGNCASGTFTALNWKTEEQTLKSCFDSFDLISGRTTTTELETTTTTPSTKITSDGQAYISLPLNGAHRVEILVKAARNAFVSFSNIENDSFPPIEIRIGAVTNTKTQIYENLMKNVEVLTPAILSEIEFRKFIVEISGGEVLVFQGDEVTPIASMAITSAFELNFVGVKSQFVTSSWMVKIIK